MRFHGIILLPFNQMSLHAVTQNKKYELLHCEIGRTLDLT